MLCVFRVVGQPVPQGSMTASYNRKQGVAHVHHVQGTALALWRAEVREAAYQAGATLTVAPVALSVTFGMPRPKAQTTLKHGQRVVKMEHYYDRPAVAPDLDKLVRAVMDALTGVCYHDDAQVVTVMAHKIYAGVTEVVVADAWGQDEQGVGQKSNAPRLGLIEVASPATRQLRLPIVREKRRSDHRRRSSKKPRSFGSGV
jgi:Holliday junction resolvase RusA-like endonuclease